MPRNPLEFVQEWYLEQCDGEWEHQFGIEIGTLDNPGWRLAVDITETELAGAVLDRQVVDEGKRGWWQAWCDGSTFHAAAGPANLHDALGQFRSFAESRGSKSRASSP